MAFLYETSFRPSADVATNQPYLAADLNYLNKTLISILDRVSGAPVVTADGRLYTKVPRTLHSARDSLKRNYTKIWDDTIIYYDAEAYGASAHLKDLFIFFGYFFTKPQPELILEKVFWHEFLHLVIDYPKQMHHGHINRIMRRSLKIPGDPNPLGTVGLEC